MSRLMRGQMNLSLAAYYGAKPQHFADLIRWFQALLASHIPGAFRPYELGQVHATIVGLEGSRVGERVMSHHYRKLGQSRAMDIGGLLNVLETTSLIPMRARIGGFKPGDAFAFKSQEQHPYLRSFGIQPSNIVAAMGWPVVEDKFPPTLDLLRREFNKCNIIHKYHKTEKNIDNDLYFVLGKVNPSKVSNENLDVVAEAIRAQLADSKPVYLDLAPEDLSLVAYVDNELPLATSVPIPLGEARGRIDEITALYRQEAT